MQITNIHEAKSQLSKLIEKAQKGEDIIIAKAGKPIAKLIPYNEKFEQRKIGLWQGKVWLTDDFDNEDSEINSLFYANK